MAAFGSRYRKGTASRQRVAHVEDSQVVEGANRCNVVIIPIGGGTSVSNALNCPPEEARTICSLDMALLNKVLYIDDANLVCRAQAGIVGQDLEKQLNDKGFTCGHEPDSVEFSTLGGWVATRASGMKKNRYGSTSCVVAERLTRLFR